MRRGIVYFFSFALAITSGGCSVNVLENFADKTTNEALYNDALIAMNAKDFDAALTKIGLMTGEYPALRKIVKLKAEANAGLCGLDFIPFILAMKDIGTTRLFPFLLGHFSTGTTAKIDYCKTAEDLIESIGTVATRTSDENMDLLLISFAKLGNILSYYTDADDSGAVDAAYNSCAIAPITVPATRAVGPLDNDDVQQIGTALTLAIENISAIGSTNSLDLTAITDVQTACASLPPGYDFCSVTTPTFDANQLAAIRSFVNESQDIGLGTCTGDVSTCACPP